MNHHGKKKLDGVVARKGKTSLQIKKDDLASKDRCKAEAAMQRHAARLRTWEYKAARAMKLKLGHFPVAQVQNNKDSEGKRIFEKVVDEMQRLSHDRKYLAIDFWTKLIRDHGLHGGFASQLPAPQQEEHVCKELNSSLKQCHCSNPAAKSCTQLLRWLAYSKPPNRTEFIGLLAGSAESPSLSKSMSHRILQGVIKFVARTRADQTHDDVWKQVSTHFDGILVREWQVAQSKGTSVSQFLRTWRNELSLYMDMQMATDLNASTEDDKNAMVDARILDAVCSGSLIASELFAPERCSLEVQTYVKDIQKRLDELELQDFSVSEVNSFKMIMNAHSGTLDEPVWNACLNSSIAIDCLGATQQTKLVHPNDHWSYRLAATIKTNAVSNGKLRRTLWETWMFGDTFVLANVPENTHIDEALIFDAENAREWSQKQKQSTAAAVRVSRTMFMLMSKL